MAALKFVSATCVHTDGTTSMVDIHQGPWPEMQEAISNALLRPEIAVMFLGTLRIENPTAVPYPCPDYEEPAV